MKVLGIVSLLFFLGLTVHYLYKDNYVQVEWDRYYFLWDKVKDLLLFFGYLYFIPKDKVEFRVTVKAICFFCIVRIVWEVLAISKDYVYASNIRIIDVLFALLLLSVSWVWIKSNIYGKKRSINMGLGRDTRLQ